MARPHNLQTRYTDEEREKALQLLAITGNARFVGDELGIPASTLYNWKDTHAQRYAEIRAEVVPAMQSRLAAENEDLAILFLEKARQAAELFDPLEIDQKDLPKAVQSFTTSGAINTDKAQMLRGLPTHIVQKQDANQLVEQLARLTGQVIEGTAEEITDPEQLAVGGQTDL